MFRHMEVKKLNLSFCGGKLIKAAVLKIKEGQNFHLLIYQPWHTSEKVALKRVF